jgi:malonate decarboxylase delta subunit
MRILEFEFEACRRPAQRVHVGVVASGDLEILLEPRDDQPDAGTHAHVRVRTSVDGFDQVWQATLRRFFDRTPVLGRWELNDAGATPAIVTLRLQQAADAAGIGATRRGDPT